VIHIDTDKLKKDKSVPAAAVEVYKYLKEYMECPERSEWLKARERGWKLVGENEQWTAGEKAEMEEQKQIPLTDNKVRKGVQGGCALVTDQKPEIQFHPIGSSDLYVAELLKRGHDVIWDKNNGSDTTYEYCEEAKVGGAGILVGYFNPDKGPFGRIMFEEENPEDVYWDKNSRKADWSDTHIVIAKLRTKGYIKDRYPDLKEKDLFYQEELQGKSSANKTEGVTAGDNYAVEGGKKGRDTDGDAQPLNVWEIWAWLLKVKKEHWVIYMDPVKGEPVPMQFEPENPKKAIEEAVNAVPEGAEFIEYWPRTREKRVVRHIVGKKLIPQTDSSGNEVTELENPFGEDSDGDPVCPIIPLLRQKTSHAYRKGDAFFALDLNKVSSKAFMNFLHTAAHNVNAPIIETDDAHWIGNPGTPGSRVRVPKTIAAHLLPHRMAPGSVEAQQWMVIKQAADDAINDALDMPDVMRGKVPEGQKNMSGRLGLALQDLAGMMSKPFLRSLESSLVRLAKVNMSLALRYWPRYMWERLLEEDEKTSWLPDQERSKLESQRPLEEQGQPFEPDDQLKMEIAQRWAKALELIRPADPNEPPGIDLLDLDVRLTAGSSMPTNRLAKLQEALEMGQMGWLDAESGLKFLDWPESDQIIARLKQNQQQQMVAENMRGGKR